MNKREVGRLADKVRVLLDESINTLEHAMFALEIMRPLTADDTIINPLNQTFAANALNALTWTLYSQAAMDACKATLDADDRSASVAAAMTLLKNADIVKVLHDRRTAPVKVNVHHDSTIPVELQRELEDNFMQEEQERAAREFEEGLKRARGLFAALLRDPSVKRLKKARNKILAHTDTVLDGNKYRRRAPKDYGLTWGDAEHVTRLGAELVTVLMAALFGHGIAIDEAPAIFAGYAGDFWRHLRKGLEVNGGGPDKPVRRRALPV